MKTRFLFSHKFKIIGWILLCLGLILGIFLLSTDFNYPSIEFKVFPFFGEKDIFSNTPFKWSLNNISDEVASILIIIGGILVSFSKTKDEDEYISKIRMESLIWATYVNYGILILAEILVFGISFFDIMIVNMFTILLFFIVRFHYVLYKLKKVVVNE